MSNSDECSDIKLILATQKSLVADFEFEVAQFTIIPYFDDSDDLGSDLEKATKQEWTLIPTLSINCSNNRYLRILL